MINPKKKRLTFSPSIDQSNTLEERVVLSRAGVASHFTAGTTAQNMMTIPQVRAAYNQQFKAATLALRQTIAGDTQQLFANGRPTAQQLADFKATVAGQVDATAFRLLGQESLLPNSSSRLTANLQNMLLGNQGGSFLSRLNSLTSSGGAIRSASALANALNNQVTTTFLNGSRQLGSYFNTTSLNRLSVNSSGQAIPLQQYLANGVMSQLTNSLGSLSNGFGRLATSSLYANGVTSPTNSALSSFQNQLHQGLNTTAFQLANNLALFPNGTSKLGSQISSSLFGSGAGTTGTTNQSLLAALQGLNYTNSTGLGTSAGTAFNNAYNSLSSPLNIFFGLNSGGMTRTTATLPTSGFSNPFSTNFSAPGFYQGFNNGFGTGFIGLGSASPGSSFNNSFGTGFNNYIGAINSNLGFGRSTIGIGSGTTSTSPIGSTITTGNGGTGISLF